MESKKKKKKIKWIEYDELQSYTLDCGLDLGLGCRMQMRWCGWVHVGHVIGFFFFFTSCVHPFPFKTVMFFCLTMCAKNENLK